MDLHEAVLEMELERSWSNSSLNDALKGLLDLKESDPESLWDKLIREDILAFADA